MLAGLKGLLVSVIGLAVATALGGFTLAQQPTPTAPVLAACPTGVTLTVSPPSASAPTTVTVTLSSQPTEDPTAFHFDYFVDTDPTAAGQEIPIGNPKIIHAHAAGYVASTTQDLGALSAGQHTVWVVLSRSPSAAAIGRTACDLRGSVTFTVAAAQPGTGSRGYLDQNSSRLPMVTWLALASASLVVLCLGVGLRRRTRRV